MLRKFKYLPKNAEPIDKLSFVGTALFSGATPSFKFVYKFKRRFYVIQCFGGFNAPVSKIITTKNLFENGKSVFNE